MTYAVEPGPIRSESDARFRHPERAQRFQAMLGTNGPGTNGGECLLEDVLGAGGVEVVHAHTDGIDGALCAMKLKKARSEEAHGPIQALGCGDRSGADEEAGNRDPCITAGIPFRLQVTVLWRIRFVLTGGFSSEPNI
jgi:hypothetical protein